jgi:hypothetical protein
MGRLGLLVRELTSDVRAYLVLNGVVALVMVLCLSMGDVWGKETCDGILHQGWYLIAPTVTRILMAVGWW